jgi:hypothetical protein
MKFEFFRQIFEKYPDIVSNLMKAQTVEAELFHEDRQNGRRMDRHDEANSRFS